MIGQDSRASSPTCSLRDDTQLLLNLGTKIVIIQQKRVNLPLEFIRFSQKRTKFKNQDKKIMKKVIFIMLAEVSKALKLPETIVPLCVIAIGHPAEQPAPKDKWKPENVSYNEFGGKAE